MSMRLDMAYHPGNRAVTTWYGPDGTILNIILQKAIDAERSRQLRDLSGVPTAVHFTQWVTNAIAANICG